jgi:hypothetical protein
MGQTNWEEIIRQSQRVIDEADTNPGDPLSNAPFVALMRKCEEHHPGFIAEWEARMEYVAGLPPEERLAYMQQDVAFQDEPVPRFET